VRLPENPSTGFRWREENSDETALQFQGDAFVLDPASKIGGGGHRTFSYRALKTAEVKLHFGLRRPWERQQTNPADTFNILLSIR